MVQPLGLARGLLGLLFQGWGWDEGEQALVLRATTPAGPPSQVGGRGQEGS